MSLKQNDTYEEKQLEKVIDIYSEEKDLAPIVITTGGRLISVLPKNGISFTTEELQSIVGGYIERVEFPNGTELWVNEGGKIRGLTLNKIATALWRRIYQFDFGEDAATDFIVGDCLICKPKYTQE